MKHCFHYIPLLHSLIRKSIWEYERNHFRFFYLRILNPKHTFVTSLIASLKPRHANKSDWTDGVSLKIYSVGHVCARVNDAIELLAARGEDQTLLSNRIAELFDSFPWIRDSTIAGGGSSENSGSGQVIFFLFLFFFFSFSFWACFPWTGLSVARSWRGGPSARRNSFPRYAFPLISRVDRSPSCMPSIRVMHVCVCVYVLPTFLGRFVMYVSSGLFLLLSLVRVLLLRRGTRFIPFPLSRFARGFGYRLFKDSFLWHLIFNQTIVFCL